MAETFNLSELVIPGTYIRVRAEALISAGGISTGNIGIVGTASAGVGERHILSDYNSAQEAFGPYDAYSTKALNLTRAIDLLFRNGARTVYARAVAADAAEADFVAAFAELIKDDVNILVVPELATDSAKTMLQTLVDNAEGDGKDMMAVVGCDATAVDDIKNQLISNKRVIMCAPGIVATETVEEDGKPVSKQVELDGNYTAAAVAGLLSSLVPQSSPTNKVLSGVGKLTQRFSYGEMKDLVSSSVLVLEERRGVRVVRGLTTDDGAFTQITTRRITDFAKAGIRQVSNPFIGRLNNERVRKAMQGAIDGFLTSMVQDEALIGYQLEVTATRQDEIAGRAMVNVLLQPTFSIDFVAVTMVLE
jgi:hypothetical protein